MRVSDIRCGPDDFRECYPLRVFLERARDRNRIYWTDLTKSNGIYVVSWPFDQRPTFRPDAGEAIHAVTSVPHCLQRKWERICAHSSTDMIYVGKADCLKKRVRSLVRFGVGRAKNHHGGEWMWQIEEIEDAHIMVQTVPTGMQVGFENWLLERFHLEHGEHPLANRFGPIGPDRWHPETMEDS